MSSQCFAAQPGVFARWTAPNGATFEEPVVAFLVETQAINPSPKPIGLAGFCDDNAGLFIRSADGAVSAYGLTRVGD